jgi:hypothetical protein
MEEYEKQRKELDREDKGMNKIRMSELVYGPIAAQGSIEKKWPNAKFQDESDYIHEERFSVNIDGIDEKEFWKFACGEGFLGSCFKFRL